ncbi:aspartate/glutamate racemase family protein [Acidimicrobiaceae bacterium AH-315-P05]|nr:aspartate/glutamate racemase family protein [Acidimicrobiaceae bacterium AH-315-P05]
MKTIGLLGGMSWESSIEYERIINEGVRNRLGGTASADLLIRSYNFAAIETLQAAGEWNAAGELLAADAKHLEAGGADFILLCTNTMHVVAPAIEAAIGVPFLHLADTTAAAVKAAGIETVALLGTRYTMEEDFYRGRLESHELTVIVPDEPDLSVVHDIIYQELVRGIVNADSKRKYLEVIDRLTNRGARAVIAGCTEIELLVGSADIEVPYFPTARLHAEAAIEAALG